MKENGAENCVALFHFKTFQEPFRPKEASAQRNLEIVTGYIVQGTVWASSVVNLIFPEKVALILKRFCWKKMSSNEQSTETLFSEKI